MNGFVPINKPVGLNSNKILSIVKSKLREAFPLKGEGAIRVGHMGTLDPDANGVLVVSIGKATRLFDLFKQKEKTYESIFKFGVETDTLDSSGKIINTSEKIPTKEEIEIVIKNFEGKQIQIPPKFSAIWVNGSRSYTLARQNVEVNLAGKEIEIKKITYLKQINNKEHLLEIVCSSGTYIRALCRDLAYSLNTYGITTSITRTKCGIFDINDALKIEDITLENITKKIITPCKVFPFIPEIELNLEEIKKLLDGNSIKKDNITDGLYFVKHKQNDIMLAEVEKENLKIKINLKEQARD